jgi:hypothetical protein
MNPESNTAKESVAAEPIQIEGSERNQAHHTAVERMLVGILDEVPTADLWDAIYDARRQDLGRGPGPVESSPRYSNALKRRSRTAKR